LDPFCSDGDMPDDLRALFWKAPASLADTSFWRCTAKCGFVDAEGNPNPDYASADERIQAFAASAQR